MLSAGIVPLLFMTPFWLAGAIVAKTAVYDPFVSSTLTIGEYLWTLEKHYFKKIGIITTRKEEGSTQYLKGSSVELAIVVNNVPKHELKLFADGKVISFGRGLAVEELRYISDVINDHCAMFSKS